MFRYTDLPPQPFPVHVLTMTPSKVQQALDVLFADLSDATPTAEKQLMDLAINFREAMAKAIGPVINHYIVNNLPSDLQRCQSVATHVNHVLEVTGQCAVVDGQAALLMGIGSEAGGSEDAHLALAFQRNRNRVGRVPVDVRDPKLNVMPMNAASWEAIDQLYRSRGGRQRR